MTRLVVRYRTKPDEADANTRLIEGVFAELKAAAPDSVRYAALRLEDNTFVHVFESTGDDNPLTQMKAFQDFQAGIKDRCAEPPNPQGATIIGNYGMLSE